MDKEDKAVKIESDPPSGLGDAAGDSQAAPAAGKKARKPRKSDANAEVSKRRCVSTACIACRRRKSKCDGSLPACMACSSVYGTECVYDPASDHRRKGVYRKDSETKSQPSTFQTLIQALLNYPEEEVPALVRRIRTCENLDLVAESVADRAKGEEEVMEDGELAFDSLANYDTPTFESQLSSTMGEMRLDDGSIKFIGGTSNLLFLDGEHNEDSDGTMQVYDQQDRAVASWTTVTEDAELIRHLLHHYFTWHYTFFTLLSKNSFYRHFYLGRPLAGIRRRTDYCTPLLVNAMLALGCHFTSRPEARADPDDPATAGDHFFMEAKRLLMQDGEFERPRLATIQALALMSLREAGCAREAKGWTFSGMAFRMTCDLGLSFHPNGVNTTREASPDDDEDDVRRITFWGCFLIDKCWSNYLGRLPLFLTTANVTVPRFQVFPDEDAETWSAYTDFGDSGIHSQPSRVRAVSIYLSKLCEISGDIMKSFYHPEVLDKPISKQTELKRLGELHSRLEEWRRLLPKEMEPKEGALPSVLTMHMLFQLLKIHLFRPFLKYNQATSPLPSHVSPRRSCTQAATTISKMLRLYKRSYGLRQICNIAVYIAHSACTIHLLNLPDKGAKRDFAHGCKHLEEIAEGWLCARRTLRVLSLQARRWKLELPDEARVILKRTDAKFGELPEAKSPSSHPTSPAPSGSPNHHALQPEHSSALISNVIEQQDSPAQDYAYTMNSTPLTMGQGLAYDRTHVSASSAPSQLGDYHNTQPSPAVSTSHLSDMSNSTLQQSFDLLRQRAAANLGNQNSTVETSLPQSTTALTSSLKYPQPSLALPNQPFLPPTDQRHQPQHRTLFQSSQQRQPSYNHSHGQPDRLSSVPINNPIIMGHPSQNNVIDSNQSYYPGRTSSSSDPFGGVEALLRDQEWWVKDQSSLVSGFGNWQGNNPYDLGDLNVGRAQLMQQSKALNLEQSQNKGQNVRPDMQTMSGQQSKVEGPISKTSREGSDASSQTLGFAPISEQQIQPKVDHNGGDGSGQGLDFMDFDAYMGGPGDEVGSAGATGDIRWFGA